MGGMPKPSPVGGSPKGLGAPLAPARCPIRAANGLGGPAPPEPDPDGVDPGAPPNAAKGLNAPMDPELPPMPMPGIPGNKELAKKKA